MQPIVLTLEAATQLGFDAGCHLFGDRFGVARHLHQMFQGQLCFLADRVLGIEVRVLIQVPPSVRLLARTLHRGRLPIHR